MPQTAWVCWQLTRPGIADAQLCFNTVKCFLDLLRSTTSIFEDDSAMMVAVVMMQARMMWTMMAVMKLHFYTRLDFCSQVAERRFLPGSKQ